MKSKRLPTRLMVWCALILWLAALLPQPVAAGCGDQTLAGVTTGINATTTSTTFVNAGSGVSVDRAGQGAAKVLVVASFETKNESASKQAGVYRLASSYSSQISLEMARQTSSDNDYGIGSVAYVFDAPAGQTTTFNLQHHNSLNATLNTAGTLVAIPLTTSSGGYSLNYGIATKTASFAHSSDSYAVIPDTTVELTLNALSDVYLVSSLNNAYGSGGTSRTGEWRIWRRIKMGESTWSDWVEVGLPAQRNLSDSSDLGIANLTAIASGLSAGTHQFAVAVRVVSGGLTVNTTNVTLIGVATSFDAGGSSANFPTFQVSGEHTTNSTTLIPALSSSVTLEAGEKVFLGSQYSLMTTDTGSPTGIQDLSLGSYDSTDQRRYINGSTDRGSGASVGLASVASAGSYTAALRHRSLAGKSVTLLDAVLVGVRLDSVCGLPTALVLGSFSARSAPGAMVLRWQAASELGVVGFRLERSAFAEGPFEELSFVPVDEGGDGNYLWIDRDVVPGTHYYYRIESLGGVTGASVGLADALHWKYFMHLPLASNSPA